MKLSTVLPFVALSTAVSAQLDILQNLLNPQPSKERITPVPNVVYPIDRENYRYLLQGNDLEWLVLFTTGPESCPGCVLYETTFNETVALLEGNGKIHFGRVDCDAEAVICSIFSAWGSRVYHISHSNPSSKSLPGLTEHLTHLHPVPFHRPGTEPPPPTDENGQPIKDAKPAPPPPDAKWMAEVVDDEKWRGFNEWEGWTHPFDGWGQVPLYQWWWVVGLFAKVPPMAMMVGIGLFSRFVTGRFTGRVQARREQVAAAVAQQAKKKN
ncbi:hypothetical protein TWF481_006770 [Arthrobotrys musiformis]|uniref:Thioredoxin domain-containing protein n=1 Tax=Arthrobotrys musiformis TaxID=47236 RepID=A0AAV9W9G9_9PEZI